MNKLKHLNIEKQANENWEEIVTILRTLLVKTVLYTSEVKREEGLVIDVDLLKEDVEFI